MDFKPPSGPDLRISPPRVPMDGFKPSADLLSPPWLPKSSQGLKLTVSDGSEGHGIDKNYDFPLVLLVFFWNTTVNDG